jgi:hypothetical protein
VTIEKIPSWEADIRSTSQIPRLLWNPKAHYRVHKSPLLAPNLSQMHHSFKFPPCIPNIHSNIIFRSTPSSSGWSRRFIFSGQNFLSIYLHSHACNMPRPSHPPWFHHPNSIWWSVKLTKLLIMHPSPFSCHFHLCPHILLNILFTHILNLCSSPKVGDQVSHPYKATGKIIVLLIPIF